MALFGKKPENEPVPSPQTHAEETDHEFDQAAVDAVMKKYDREANTRIWEGWQ